MIQVKKTVAKQKFAEGAEIAVVPCKVNPHSVLGIGYLAWMKDNGEPDAFEKLCNAVRYYNCNTELGMGLSYYLKEA